MSIVPKPQVYTENGILSIAPHVQADERLVFCVKAFSRMAHKLYGVRFSAGEGGIALRYDETLAKDEYRIKGAEVYASSVEGGGYGLSTMLQIMECADGALTIKDTEIFQKPQRDYRAFFTDLARGWHDFDFLLSYVDLCYLNKYRYFQLHLMDDQGWTMPLDCFPQVADPVYSYTKAEIRYLVEYAYEAGVIVIPEFEGVGHSRWLIKYAPEQFGNDFGENSDIDDNVMCIGREGIFESIETILRELADVFHYSPYIHIGCDEAFHEKWEHCPRCRAYMEKHGITGTKSLYTHFVSKIANICLSVGKTPVVWEGFAAEEADQIPKETIIVIWESYYQLATEALASGFKIINASWKPMYVVPDTRPNIKWNIAEEEWDLYTWQNWNKKSPAYVPMHVEPTEQVIGSMFCQWECTPEEERQYLLLNFPIAADRTWNVEGYYSQEEIASAGEKLYALQEKLFVL